MLIIKINKLYSCVPQYFTIYDIIVPAATKLFTETSPNSLQFKLIYLPIKF